MRTNGEWTDTRTFDWVDAHVEAYVDGELSSEESRRLEAIVRSSPDAGDMLRLARTVRDGLDRIETPACPPEITHAVLAQARREAELAPAPIAVTIDRFRTRLDVLWAQFLRPSLAAAALAAVVAIGALLGRAPSPGAEIAAAEPATEAFAGVEPGTAEPVAPLHNDPSPVEALHEQASAHSATPSSEQAEVAQALREAKWALAFVSDVSREAGQSIRRNVLEDRVAAPIQRALGTAFDQEPTS